MVNFFRSIYVKHLCLYCALGSFSLSTIPLYGIQASVTDIAFALKMEKLVEKMKKLDLSNRPKLIKTLFEIKQEAEIYLNQNINIDDMLNTVEHRIKKSNINISKEDLKKFKKLIKSKGKRVDHKYAYMAECLVHGIEYSSELEELNFIKEYRSNKDTSEDEDIINARIEYGCTLMLAGAILEFTGYRLGVQPVQRLGDILFGLGLGFLADEAIDKVN